MPPTTLFAWDPVRDGHQPFTFSTSLWRLLHLDGPCLAVTGNDDIRDQTWGHVALFGDPAWTDVAVEAEMRFLKGRMPENPLRGWFGFALRAQDVHNYELFWLMPQHSGKIGAVAYVPVAHGVVPWWTEAYRCQAHGRAEVPADAWIRVRAEVRGRVARLYVGGALALEKELTYYLSAGRAGLYVGTGTDAAFRGVRVEAL